MWLGKTESSSFRMSVLTDLKRRGIGDILITVTDNLNGFTDTIRAVFPESPTQICVVHQIRNLCKCVVWKDLEIFIRRSIASRPRRHWLSASLHTERLGCAITKCFGVAVATHAVQSWQRNWDELTAFFEFTVEIRKIIYITNIIENLNGKIRKYTKSKLSFPTDDALRKSVRLAFQEIEKK